MDINNFVSACILHTKTTLRCKIWGSNSGVGEESSLQGCYVVSTDKQLRTFRIIVAHSFSWRWSSSRRKFWAAWPWRWNTIIPRKSVNIYQSKKRILDC